MMSRFAGLSFACAAAAQTPPAVPPTPPTFALVSQAATVQNYTLVEQRRFWDAAGNILSVREQVQVQANGSDSPNFVVSFLGVCGELPKSVLNQKWQHTYTRYGREFFDQGSFHIRDLASVQQNYVMYQFGSVTRVGRPAYRVVVFPLAVDKSTWLIDLDAVTLAPLYEVEFDSQFRLLAEVEAESLTETPSGVTQVATPTLPGAPVVHATFAAASAFLGDPAGLVEPAAGLASGYVLDGIVTRDDPLNGRQKLVLTYTDGVDEFTVVQIPNSTDVFSSLMSRSKLPLGHTIGRYRDPAVSALVFWDDGVLFHVAGRGVQVLDDVAKAVYLQALAN